MVTIEMLRSYCFINKEIGMLKEELERVRSLSEKSTSTLRDDVVSGTRKHDKLGDIAILASDIHDTLMERISHAIELMCDIDRAIEKLPIEQRLIIRSRYVCCMSWDEIFNDSNYGSYRAMYYVHSKAIRNLSLSEGVNIDE